MTNEKAVKMLKSSMLMHSYRYSAEELEEAFDLAIKALEFKYRIQHGNCDYCKHKNHDSIDYPCHRRGDHGPI